MRLVLRVCTVLCIAIWTLGESARADEPTRPPHTAEIVGTLDALWKEGRFAELDGYVSGLVGSHPWYVPARLAHATYEYRQGAQVEVLVGELTQLRGAVSRALSATPPAFLEELDAEAKRFARSAEWYARHGVTPEQRLVMFDARSMAPEKRAASWGFGLLFATAPEITIPPNKEVQVHYAPMLDGERTNGAPEVMRRTLLDDGAPLDSRTRAARTLGGIAGVQAEDALIEACGASEWRVAVAAAETLARRADVGPRLAAELRRAPEVRTGRRTRYLLWSILKMPHHSPDVVRAVDELQSGPAMELVKEYARMVSTQLKSGS